jgi:hypothetical protein
LRRLFDNGYWNVAISRNALDNSADKFLDNDKPSEATRTFKIRSNETENKFRFDVTNNINNWKLTYGLVTQYVQFTNLFDQLFRQEVRDQQGTITQPAQKLSSNTGTSFWRYGGFIQAGTRIMDDRLALSAGVRADGNNLNSSEANPIRQLSPRISASLAVSDQLNFNASYGIYYRLPSYTQLAYSGLANAPVNPGKYIQSTHYVAGFEYLPSAATRFTVEGFYKGYEKYPVSIPDGISIANKGTDFGAIGNEPVNQQGLGRAYGFELFAQQKLTKRFFGIVSYTLYWSEFTGLNGNYAPASWDNRHLISLTTGYKLPKNWELGLKWRFQGAAPFTPYNLEQSQLNYLSLGTGIFNYNLVNTQRLPAFHAGDIRIDKKWNYRRFTFDLFLDVQNFYGFKATGVANYTLKELLIIHLLCLPTDSLCNRMEEMRYRCYCKIMMVLYCQQLDLFLSFKNGSSYCFSN